MPSKKLHTILKISREAYNTLDEIKIFEDIIKDCKKIQKFPKFHKDTNKRAIHIRYDEKIKSRFYSVFDYCNDKFLEVNHYSIKPIKIF